jgi:hypothetical protein
VRARARASLPLGGHGVPSIVRGSRGGGAGGRRRGSASIAPLAGCQTRNWGVCSLVDGMPLYEDLVRRAVEASADAALLQRDSRLIRSLAQILRDASAGKISIRRCAWCDRFEVGGEWLHLDAVGRGQVHIRTSLMDSATHGICPGCQAHELERTEGGRAHLHRGSE